MQLFLLYLSYFLAIFIQNVLAFGTGPHISQDSVWLSSDVDSLSTASDVSLSTNRYEIVHAAENAVLPPEDGLEGILYDSGLSCNVGPVTAAEENFPKAPLIALVQSGGCSLSTKIKITQKHGTVAVIFYATSHKDDSIFAKKKNMGIPKNSGITIPVFFVNPKIGRELHGLLENSMKSPPKVINGKTLTLAIRVHMFPTPTEKLPTAELVLIIAVAVCGAIMCTFAGILFYLWRRRVARNPGSGEEIGVGEVLPMGKELLHPSEVKQLLTRTIIMTPATSHQSGSGSYDDSSSLLSNEENPCAICLEGMVGGDVVRQLPCKHEYHTHCIDPWLTSKSGECPLCKANCVDALKDINGDTRGTRRERFKQKYF
ncbi:hypothetical protein J3Q64DRAFT_1873949 [Phycomyces blakesleeanus]|uniref:RING-type domain-containing protein n=2 Tax=Phycomyces blakesleeanus TaxID=4837 RepID=A0A167K8Y6_PHYB8|nr:hypothetical protein PHYBLDRAFT_151414 [Phycomyces blakesleeanus NRRL 1555(-)]OAD67507.1 hypothetical protein PHYBLDRAFT_151414 [Phycomyces blakesleeanus NRRL 1555(-)]|eukprot:XP_018285547.1 hypothetical protein PHYBLDRAFT_151414 [Phycomyces blakesleeanus NRRL 1555(-)]